MKCSIWLEEGVYNMDKARQVPAPILHKYFKKGHGKSNGSIRVRNEVKRFISFGKHNLIEVLSPELFDVIFCRNVMIYFNAGTKQKLIIKLHNSLKDGGFFIIGAAEGLVGLKHNFKYIEPSIYKGQWLEIARLILRWRSNGGNWPGNT